MTAPTPAFTTGTDAAEPPVNAAPLGRLARRLYAAQCRSKFRAVHSSFHKNLRMRFPLLNNLQRAWTFARRHAGAVRRQRGIPLAHQAVQLLKLVFVWRTDPAAYYALNLYEPARRLDEIEHYIGRHESKNGLYSLMNAALPDRPDTGHSITNKAMFARY